MKSCTGLNYVKNCVCTEKYLKSVQFLGANRIHNFCIWVTPCDYDFAKYKCLL